MKRLFSILALAAGLMLAACTPKEKEVAVTGVKVSPTSLSLEIGQSAMLTATVEPSDATDKGVNWTSSDLSVAAVQEGTVKAIGAGNATIIVTTVSGGKTATCSVTVKEAGKPDNPDNPENPENPDTEVKVESVTISEDNLLMKVGDTHALMAQVTPDNATKPELEWSSSDTQVVTVDKDGTATACNAGSAVITVQSVSNPEAKATCNVTVEAVKAETVKLSEVQISIKEGETSKAIKVTIGPDNAGDKSFSVASSAPSIAEASKTSDNEFTVKGISGGVAEITVTAPDGPSASLLVKVLAMPKEVDLGLPSGVKWASFNVGSTAPEDYGSYFSWGETEPKENYSPDTYKLGPEPFTKYNDTDKKVYLDSEDDAATAMYGDGWRTPAAAEVRELMDKCTWSWTTINGIKGQKVTGPNGNSIFLPAAGFASYTTLGSDSESWGDYMILEKFLSPFNFNKDGFGNIKKWKTDYYYGFSVRPVKGNYVKVTSLKLDVTQLENLGPAKAKIRATVQPSNATDNLVVWSSSDESVAVVDQQGNVDILKKGLATISAECSGFVAACQIISAYSWTEPEKIDLGLPSGILWASCNLGAWEPQETGAYFAWGETEPKGYFSSSNYKFKGNTKYQYGKAPDVLQPEDDAAHVKLGGKWRIPTPPEMRELLSECTWTKEASGYTVTGPNGKSIFIPFGGWYDYELNSKSHLCIWTSSLGSSTNTNAAGLYDTTISSCSKWMGSNIRPVWAEPYPTITKLELDKHEITPKAGSKVQLTAYSGSEKLASTLVQWQSSNKDIATVDRRGLVTIVCEGRARITVSTPGSSLSDVCEIIPEYKYSQPEEIDLGLPSGLKWASCDLGATDPKKPGAYFAWGETQTKLDFTSDNYKWGICTSDDNMTKYNAVDGKMVLDPEDDAARVILGGDWRMPSMEELQEMFDACTWTKETEEGLVYFVGKSNYNNRRITIPASGLFYDNALSNYFNLAYIWSADIGTGALKLEKYDYKLHEAQYFIIDTSYINNRYKHGYPWGYLRYVGAQIRPVKGKGTPKGSGPAVKRPAPRRPSYNNSPSTPEYK